MFNNYPVIDGVQRSSILTSQELFNLTQTHNFRIDPSWLNACGRFAEENTRGILPRPEFFEPLPILAISQFYSYNGAAFGQVQTPDMPASGWCCDLRRGEWVSKPSAHSSAPFPMICRECGEESPLSPEGFCQGCLDEIEASYPREYDMEGEGGYPDPDCYSLGEEDYEEEEEPCALCGLPSAHSDFFYPHGPLCSCATALQDANEACLFMCDYSSEASKEAQEDLQVAYILASAPVKPHRRARSLPILSSRNLARLQDPKPETIPSALPVRSWQMRHLR